MNSKLILLLALAVAVSGDVCVDHIYSCRDTNNNEVGTICANSCYSWLKFACEPCDDQDYTRKCLEHGLAESHYAVRDADKECKQF